MKLMYIYIFTFGQLFSFCSNESIDYHSTLIIDHRTRVIYTYKSEMVPEEFFINSVNTVDFSVVGDQPLILILDKILIENNTSKIKFRYVLAKKNEKCELDIVDIVFESGIELPEELEQEILNNTLRIRDLNYCDVIKNDVEIHFPVWHTKEGVH